MIHQETKEQEEERRRTKIQSNNKFENLIHQLVQIHRESIEDSNDSLKREIQNLREHIASLKNQSAHSSLKQEINRKNDESFYISEIQKLNAKLNSSEFENERLLENMNTLKLDHEVLKESFQCLQTEHDNLRIKYSTLKDEFQKKKEKWIEISRKMNEIRNNHQGVVLDHPHEESSSAFPKRQKLIEEFMRKRENTHQEDAKRTPRVLNRSQSCRKNSLSSSPQSSISSRTSSSTQVSPHQKDFNSTKDFKKETKTVHFSSQFVEETPNMKFDRNKSKKKTSIQTPSPSNNHRVLMSEHNLNHDKDLYENLKHKDTSISTPKNYQNKNQVNNSEPIAKLSHDHRHHVHGQVEHRKAANSFYNMIGKPIVPESPFDYHAQKQSLIPLQAINKNPDFTHSNNSKSNAQTFPKSPKSFNTQNREKSEEQTRSLNNSFNPVIRPNINGDEKSELEDANSQILLYNPSQEGLFEERAEKYSVNEQREKKEIQIQDDKEEENQFPFLEVVRNKSERKKLHAHDCECCKAVRFLTPEMNRLMKCILVVMFDLISNFYFFLYYQITKDVPIIQELGIPEKRRLQSISRHRSTMKKRPSTPPGFWDVDFPDSQE